MRSESPLNASGLPYERQLPWGTICEEGGATVHAAALAGRLGAMGVPIDRTLLSTGDAEERLTRLEEIAETYLPDTGELFVWRGNYGVYYGGIGYD